MKYITTIIEPTTIGGFGHVFYDVITSYIISKLFNITFVYSKIDSLGEKHHTGEIPGYKHDKVDWDDFLKFNKDELKLEHLENNKNLKNVYINLCEPFKTMNVTELENFINSHEDNTLFILTNNNRIYLNELYYFNNKVYQEVFNDFKKKMLHLKKNNSNNEITISMHIRRGDWDWQPLSYNIEFIKLWRSISIQTNQKYIINIYSLGTNEQLNEIKNTFMSIDNNINFYFNKNVFETFKDIYNADIVVGGHSNFPKVITMFSTNIFIYLPYNDGIIQPLGVNKEFKLFYHGNYPELFDEQYRIETDIYISKNRDLIINKLTNIKVH